MNDRKSAGIALVAVLVTLSILLALAVPFMLSMGTGQAVAFTDSDKKTVDLASASVRDMLLSEAALGHPSIDQTPLRDNELEYPDRVVLPEAFAGMSRGGRVLLSGEVWDLQRKLHLDGVSPLAIANLLGTSARLLADLEPEADTIAVADASRFPDSGFLWIDHELVHYASRSAASFDGLTRGMFPEMGFVLPTQHTVPETGLVLDFRCVLAASWPFFGATGGLKDRRQPYSDVREVARVSELNFGGFTAGEMQLLELYCTTHGNRETATNWGRAERVFEDLEAGKDRTLRVRSALHLGAGSTVRIHNLRTGEFEYGLVMTSRVPRGRRQILLASEFLLDLMTPVTRDYPAIDTVVEPLLPYPVNVNTAPVELLESLFAGVRRTPDARVHDGDGRQRARPEPAISTGEARELAAEIAAKREGRQAQLFRNWQDVAQQLFKDRFDEARGFPEKNRWIRLYRNLLTGRDGLNEMGTAPLCFASGPMVGYRAAAAYDRGVFATGTAARMERRGIAVAMPGVGLDVSWRTQNLLDEALRLDRRSPWWLTTPVNTSAISAGERGNDPASRYFPHLLGMAFPTAGFGQPRFPDAEGRDAAIQPAPSFAPIGVAGAVPISHESFSASLDPRGRRIESEGVYLPINTGPRDRTPQERPAFDGDHSRIRFPFTEPGGVAGRFGVQFWAQPEALRNQTLFDYSDGDDERNRIAVQFLEGNLVLEVLDEAGLDPNPSVVDTAPDRSAASWTVPLTEFGLQPDVPVHFNFSAYGNRPGELSLLVDGVPRGKPRFMTWLTAPVPVYDQVNQAPVRPGGRGERYVDLYVESTEGFPPRGVLRIGLELFEYTEVGDGVFHCRFHDSMGGRMARMAAREYRPTIPVDERGRPVVDPDNLPGGANLDVAPAHPVGAAVELYGYSTALYRDSILQVGSTALAESVSAFAVARGYVDNGVAIDVQGPVPPGQTIHLGTGLDETFNGDIELYPPVPLEPNNPQPDDRIANAFPQSGGYALLVQHQHDWDYSPPGSATSGESVITGGAEVIRYNARNGNRLTGIQRAFPLPGDNRGSNRDFMDGRARKFVTDWENVQVRGPDGPWTPADEAATMMLFVVPISLPVQNVDVLVDPETLGYSEWLQLFPRGADESDTEWVRYDLIQDRRHVVRSNRAAWEQLRIALTFQHTVEETTITGGSAQVTLPLTDPWPQPRSTSGYIGYIERVEEEYPAVHAARESLRFRGDTLTGTTSHAHGPATVVLPVHRMELDWGNYGALSARAGRNDRVSFVKGSDASGSSRPPVEWHVVNWTARRYGVDRNRPEGGEPFELLGPWPFQLVGLKDQLASFYEGPAERQDFVDTRLVDRMVKFPSGELPSAYVEEVTLGASASGGMPVEGILDEITVVDQVAEDLVLEEEFSDSAGEFRVRPDLRITGYGPVAVGEDLSAAFPAGGGLVMVDGEILAYQTRDEGVFQVAGNGRGLLGTEARSHDRGTRVRFLTHVPAAILAEGVQPQSDVLTLQSLGGLPSTSGTVLLGNELLHYAWTRSSGGTRGDDLPPGAAGGVAGAAGGLASLEMPRWFPPGEVEGEGGRPRGLLRGRYGTVPQGAGAGEPVIWFPFRYWDRYRENAEDPELAYFQFSHVQAPVLWSGIQWDEEIPDATVGVRCYVRIDGKGSFADDPEAVPGLFLFRHGEQDDRVLPIDYQGSGLEARFYTVYREGAFDPQTFLAQGWKTAPLIRNVRVQYEGQGRIVHEEVTAR